MVKVVFTYDEESRKWVPTVEGAVSHKEGRQAFSAVVLTCQQLNQGLLQHARLMKTPDDTYVVYPAV